MKHAKRIASVLLALVMAMALMVPALAANTNSHTITIDYEKPGHTYTAYQIFKGDIANGKLTNIEWGSGVDGAAVLTALNTLASYKDCKDAKDVADVLAGFEDNSEELDAFAEVVGAHLATPSGSSKETKSPYTINVTGDGYYLVKDTGTIAEGDAATKYVLEVVKDVTVEAKADAPGLDKKIDPDYDTDGDEVEYNNAAVGDEVPFKLTSRVPDMDGYAKYFFIVNDTMSKGLAFKNDVAITIGTTKLEKDTDYTVTTGKSGTDTTIEIVFKNFIQWKGQAGAPIVITYSATVTDEAEIGTAGNPNKAVLTYSNNPNITDNGSQDNPDKPTQPTGKTPESKTITYVTGVELLKVNQQKETLAGAEFEITGTKLNKVIVTGQKYVVDENGTFYLLKDGTYTDEAPNGNEEHDAAYADKSTKYMLKTVAETVTKAENVKITATTDSKGILKFAGLSEGEYVITEIKAPSGYNILETPINVEITWVAPVAPSENCQWEVESNGAAVVENGIIKLTVENRSGATLPSTGGMGTTLFYVLGSILVLGAVILLVTKKRMSGEK